MSERKFTPESVGNNKLCELIYNNLAAAPDVLKQAVMSRYKAKIEIKTRTL